MPRLITLTMSQTQICDNTLRSRGMIAPNLGIVAALAMMSPTLVRHLRQYYTGPTGDGTLDTYERELLFDMVAENYCGISWPCNMDGVEYTQRFFDTLMGNSSMVGWVFETADT